MYREKSRQKPKPEDAGDDYKPEYETYTELETLNSMVPIWKRPKNEVKDEDYNEFYKNKFMDYTDPLRVITSRTEGTATYTALLFIPRLDPVRLLHQGVREGSGAVCLRRYDHGEVCRPAAGLFQLCEGCCGQRGSESEHQP